jgi:hypothetical protein
MQFMPVRKDGDPPPGLQGSLAAPPRVDGSFSNERIANGE